MKDKTILVLITILFLITGSLLLFSALNEYSFGGDEICVINNVEYVKGEEIERYLYGSTCVCGSGGLVECIPDAGIEPEQIQLDEDAVDRSDLDTEGLEFEYSYVVGLNSEDLSSVFPVEFESISVTDDDLFVVVEQLQSCPSSNRASEQEGFYKMENGFLSLYNIVHTSQTVLEKDCIVKLVYAFSDFEGFDREKFEIRFVDEHGVATTPNVCFYHDRIYSPGDVFQGSDGQICVCNQGLIECE